MKKLKLLNIKAAEEVGKQLSEKDTYSTNNYDNIKALCHQIHDNIFISSYKIAQNQQYLRENEFTHIINCASNSKSFTPEYYDGFKYYLFDVKDHTDFDLMPIYFNFIFLIEDILLDKKAKILIHCFEGISRAPTLLSSYMIWKFKLSFEEVYKLIKQKRPCIDINIGFASQLIKFNQLLKLDMDDKIYISDKNNNLTLFNKAEVSSSIIIESKVLFFFNSGKLHLYHGYGPIDGDMEKTQFYSNVISAYEKLDSSKQIPIIEINLEKFRKNINFDEELTCSVM